jgi:hypothetical protein
MRNLILASAAAGALALGLGVGGSALAQAGSYQQTCRNPQNVNGQLTAECADAQGQYHSTSIAAGQCRGDIANRNGTLSCPGAQGTSGPVVGGRGGGPGPQAQYGGDRRGGDRGGDRRDERRDDRAAAAVAGAVVGALIGPPPPPPPGVVVAPGRDWRYERGGWGYGHRPGEWVPIRDRANWIDQRIDRAQRDGRLGRRDARDLRRQLDDIVDQERRYDRDGRIGPRERDDLERRFDDLERRIDYRTRG